MISCWPWSSKCLSTCLAGKRNLIFGNITFQDFGHVLYVINSTNSLIVLSTDPKYSGLILLLFACLPKKENYTYQNQTPLLQQIWCWFKPCPCLEKYGIMINIIGNRRNCLWFRLQSSGYKNTLPRRASQANMHGKTRAGVVCFSLERKTNSRNRFRL